jgi:hypothetical protein
MIVSTDQVAADAFGATLLDKTVDELAFIKKAEAIHLGTADCQSLNPVIESRYSKGSGFTVQRSGL